MAVGCTPASSDPPPAQCDMGALEDGGYARIEASASDDVAPTDAELSTAAAYLAAIELTAERGELAPALESQGLQEAMLAIADAHPELLPCDPRDEQRLRAEYLPTCEEDCGDQMDPFRDAVLKMAGEALVDQAFKRVDAPDKEALWENWNAGAGLASSQTFAEGLLEVFNLVCVGKTPHCVLASAGYKLIQLATAYGDAQVNRDLCVDYQASLCMDDGTSTGGSEDSTSTASSESSGSTSGAESSSTTGENGSLSTDGSGGTTGSGPCEADYVPAVSADFSTTDGHFLGGGMDWTSTDFTWAMWVKRGVTNDVEMVVMQDHGTDGIYMQLRPTTSDFVVRAGPHLANVVGLASTDDQEWHLYVGVREGTTHSLYVDGQLDFVDVTAGFVTPNTTEPLEVGVDDVWGPSTFRLANITMWDAPLSAAAVSELYNGGTMLVSAGHSWCENVIHEWRFGNDAADSGMSIADVIGGNDLTMNGAGIAFVGDTP